jgi:hypothetical protein
MGCAGMVCDQRASRRRIRSRKHPLDFGGSCVLRVSALRSYKMSSCCAFELFGEVSDFDGDGGRNRGVEGRVSLSWCASEPESSGSSLVSEDDIMKPKARMVGVGVGGISAIAAKPTPAPPHWGLSVRGSRPLTATEPPGGGMGS